MLMNQNIPEEVLKAIQKEFHAIITGRADNFIKEHKIELPTLELLKKSVESDVWFPIPSMYGGFKFRLECDENNQYQLISESWSRSVEGSGQRHVITNSGSDLIEEGFV